MVKSCRSSLQWQWRNECAHKARATRQEEITPSFFHCPYIGFHQMVWPRLKGCLITSRSGLKVHVIPPQDPDQRHAVFLPQHLDDKCTLHIWIVVHSRYSQVDNKECHQNVCRDGDEQGIDSVYLESCRTLALMSKVKVFRLSCFTEPSPLLRSCVDPFFQRQTTNSSWKRTAEHSGDSPAHFGDVSSFRVKIFLFFMIDVKCPVCCNSLCHKIFSATLDEQTSCFS